jgi:hypothetical protein
MQSQADMRSDLLARLQRVASDALTLYLLPLFTALLPWSIGFAWLRYLARRGHIYRELAELAWSQARGHLPACDEGEWKYRFRLLRLVDHADTYLTLLRTTRWWSRRIEQHGAWPAPGGAHVFLTYHWGAGNWVWRCLRAQGFDAYFLARRAQGRALGATRLSHWYGALRAWAIRRIGSRGPWFVGGSRDALLRELHAGANVVGMLDLPAAPEQRALDATLLDGHVRFPAGLAELGVQSGARITLFSAGLDAATGRRRLWVEDLPAGLSLEEIMRRYAAHLHARLGENPEFWQIWNAASAMFVSRAAAPQLQAL